MQQSNLKGVKILMCFLRRLLRRRRRTYIILPAVDPIDDHTY